MGCWGALEHLDAALSACAREEAGLRLRLGQVLEVLRRSGCFELGFSSIGAYALERVERSGRWAESARCIARRLEALPQLRAAVASGRLSWSMGELLARVALSQDAGPQDEEEWIRQAQGRTLREVRALCQQEPGERESKEEATLEETVRCTLTCSVDREDAWLFEATRALLESLGTHGAEAQAEALLAEAQDTLLAGLPRGTLELEELELTDVARESWLEQLRRWRNEAEARCEPHFRGQLERPHEVTSCWANDAALGMASLTGKSAAELDMLVRGLASAFAAHELELSRRLLELHRADGWRRLGYATEGQYARERLGMSRSSLLARRALALRLEQLPAVAAALGAARIGVEAALQLVRVATPRTEAAWLKRAQQRTVKHLREEVVATLTAVRLSGNEDCPPPLVPELDAYHNLERAVVSGDACRRRSEPAAARRESGEAPPVERSAWFEMLQSLSGWLERGVQFSAAPLSSAATGKRSGAGCVSIRLSVSRVTRAWWRALEAQAQRWLPRGMSWLKFACLCVWRSWQHLLGVEVAYGRIYIRDRHRCSSPVCSRNDVTPHHLVFRSAGGGEESENLVSLCTWCHLFGVHGGRIRARGPASHICWELGPKHQACVRVEGRERWAA